MSLFSVFIISHLNAADCLPLQYWNARRRFVFAPQLFDAAKRFLDANGIADGRYMAIHWRYGGALGIIL